MFLAAAVVPWFKNNSVVVLTQCTVLSWLTVSPETQGNEDKAVMLCTFCKSTACTPTEQIWLYQIKPQVTQPLIRVDFILVMPNVFWWPAPTLKNLLKWINTLKICLIFFSLLAQNSSKELCHYENEIWSLWSSDASPNEHSLVFVHMTDVVMSDSQQSSFGL